MTVQDEVLVNTTIPNLVNCNNLVGRTRLWYPTSEMLLLSIKIYLLSLARKISAVVVHGSDSSSMTNSWSLEVNMMLKFPHSSMYMHSPDLVLLRLGEPSQPYRTFLVPGSILSAAVISLGVSDKLRTFRYLCNGISCQCPRPSRGVARNDIFAEVSL